MALIDKSSIVVPKGFYGKANVLQGFNPQTENLVDLDVVRNTTATRVNEQGLIESVAANVPRRDFLNGGCGELLVEPQRTNLLSYSEEFDNNYWFKLNATVTPNTGISLDGTQNADTITVDDNGNNAFAGMTSLSVSLTNNIIYTVSVFVKSLDTQKQANIRLRDNPTFGDTIFSANFDLSGEGSVINNNAGLSAKIKKYGDYFRIIGTFLGDGSTKRVTLAPCPNFTVLEGQSALFWGAQLEEGSYPSSYIPTTASAVTRNKDVISASNIGSLLNDAEGGFYIEASVFSKTQNMMLSLSDTTTDNRLFFFIKTNNTIINTVNVDGSTSFSVVKNGYNINQFLNLACRYAQDNFSYYVDGSKVGASESGNTFSNGTLNILKFANATSSFPFYGRIRELIVFDNAPTDSEMQTLTTP